MSNPFDPQFGGSDKNNRNSKNQHPGDQANSDRANAPEPTSAELEQLERELEEVEAELSYTSAETKSVRPNVASSSSDSGQSAASLVATGQTATLQTATPPLMMVETAFLASTASLLWLVSYYLSIGPWMRILFPIPIALVYLRWGLRAAWMSAITCGLLLSVLMGPYLSLLFCIPYAILGVQLGAFWRRQTPWLTSISVGTLISTSGFFMRMALLSVFLGEDLWNYLTNRISDLIQWVLSRLVNWGFLGIGALSETNLTAVQLVTIGVVLCSDFVYLFTVHLAAWLLLERLGNPIPDPPRWVQVLMEEEK